MDKSNIYKDVDWPFMLAKYPLSLDMEGKPEQSFDIKKYYSILSKDVPYFINEYASVPSMQRLKGVGLLCGTDWTKLYKNRFVYSRYDHSIAVALIIWNFTRDKIQTLAGLFHDIATAAFSHVQEFRKGDALTQSESERGTEEIIRNDKVLCAMLEKDGISIESVRDYHQYPIADNDLPCLSADRLEYMFPSGASLLGSWNLEDVQKVYSDIVVLKNEMGIDELGFMHKEIAEFYCEKFCEIGHVLQLNENKLTMQMLAEIVRSAIELGIITEMDCMNLDEEQLLCKFRVFCTKGEMFGYYDKNAEKFGKLFNTFTEMESILHTDKRPFEDDKGFCVSIDVKQRYINPLVAASGTECKNRRLSDVSEKGANIIRDFLDYEDTKWGGVAFR
ncbi:MAG: hypothetical protein UHP28_09365 [Treponema sp.]|nr:hypothetical protein [Treponema sp.]